MLAPMAWVRTIADDEAEGLLARQYREAIARAGKVFNVLRVQGLQPRVLRASTHLYTQVMLKDGPLARYQREMIATVVSATNRCAY